MSSNTALWESKTSGQNCVKLIMQPDGNLVLYTSASHPVWKTGTSGKGSSYATMQDDGNFVLYLQGAATWASKAQ